MDLNGELRSTSKTGWFNIKYLLLFLNMMLVYINSGLFFYLFSKDLRKTQNFNLKDFPNLRYSTQISSMTDNFQTFEDILEKSNSKEFNQAKLNSLNNRSNRHKYESLDDVMNMFAQQEKFDDNSLIKNDLKQNDDKNRLNLLNNFINNKQNQLNFQSIQNDQPNNQLIQNDQSNNQLIQNDQPNKQTNEIIQNDQFNDIIQNDQPTNYLNRLIDSQFKDQFNSKKNKTQQLKKPNYNDLNNLNKQLSLIYLLLGFNNFLNFICLTREKLNNFLLFLPLLSIFTILPLISLKSLNLNFEINLWLFIVHLLIAILTFIHVKRLKSTSEQVTHHLNQLYQNHHFVSIDSTLTPTSTQHFLINHDDLKYPANLKEKNFNLTNLDRKDDQLPAFKKKMNFKKITPPPSYDNV